DADGTYHACVNSTTGAMRVIDAAAQACTGSEYQITWNRGFRWRGPWNPETLYAQGDVVSYKGSSWISTCPTSLGKVPSPKSKCWQLVASVGSAGPQGIQGIQGIKGDQGVQGIQGVPGPAGLPGTSGPPDRPGFLTRVADAGQLTSNPVAALAI